MKKIFIFSLLGFLPLAQLASVTMGLTGAAFKPETHNCKKAVPATPVLPINTLDYFIQ